MGTVPSHRDVVGMKPTQGTENAPGYCRKLIKELDPEHTKYPIPVSIRAKPSSGTHLHQVMLGLKANVGIRAGRA